mmetsp:Transcript_13144/g.26961  ORF Transcript_13144/g.26961 Transcript_13144/m.26961 type:complete len:1432 (+) Transcript_13144:459-4754(+)
MESTKSSSSSLNSLPESDDGFDVKAEVRRALKFAKTIDGDPDGGDALESSRSGDTPPPPEHKSSGRYKKSQNNAFGSGDQLSTKGRIGMASGGGSKRFQFYSSETNNEETKTDQKLSKKDVHAPDPPEHESSTAERRLSSGKMAEESAMKARSRLIQLQHHRDREIDTTNSSVKSGHSAKQHSQRSIGIDLEKTIASSSRIDRADCSFDSTSDLPKSSFPVTSVMSISSHNSNSGSNGDDDEEEYPRRNMEPVESPIDDMMKSNVDDDDSGEDEYSDFRSSMPNINRQAPTRAESPEESPKDHNYINNYPSSAPQNASQRQRPRHLVQQFYNQQKVPSGMPFANMYHPNPNQYQNYLTSQNANQPRVPTRKSVGPGVRSLDHPDKRSQVGGELRSSGSDLPVGLAVLPFVEGTSLLQTSVKEGSEQDEVEMARQGVSHHQTKPMGAQGGVSEHFAVPRSPVKSNVPSGMNKQSARKAAPPPPPPPFAKLNPPPPRIVNSASNVDMGGANSLNRKPRPPPPPREISSVQSTPTNQNRPVLTAAKAMQLVMTASRQQGEIDDSEFNKQTKRMSADLMKMFIREDSESSSADDSLGGDGDDDDFEKKTSLSMHAEAKFGLGPPASQFSRHAEDKHGMVGQNNTTKVSSFDRPHTSDAMTDSGADYTLSILQNHFPEIKRASLSDHSVSDPNLFRASRPATSHVDPPDAADDLANQARYNELASTSVVPKKTAKDDLFAVETVIPERGDGNDTDGKGSNFAEGKSAFNQYSALGPRNKRFGGTTGIVLDKEDFEEKRRYRQSLGEKGRIRVDTSPSPTRINHNGVTLPQDTSDNILGAPVREEDKISWNENVALMTELCAHLLPVGLDTFKSGKSLFRGMPPSHLRNKSTPSWDDDDPDEPGYIVHQLTSEELNCVESTFEKMVNYFGQSSEKGVRKGNNENFERDLVEAELILDQEEKRYEAEAKTVSISRLDNRGTGDSDSDVDSNESDDKAQYGSSQEGSSLGSHASLDENELQHGIENNDFRQSVPDFPGIYPPGKGRPGEMECFYLPIITKSQKTGFEPTKDLVLKPGTVFANNYLVQSELGSAAFSTAYRCVDLSSEEDEEGYQDEVCLKVIKNTKDYFDQSLDEIKILQLLKDTGKVLENNIVEMKSFFYHREHLVIVTELLRQNLYEFGKSILESRGPAYFTRRRLSHITRQCLIALKFVHELGLMHCDIKPENILLASYSRALVKVIDFGSSSFVTDRQSSYIQSRSYRAPEVILGLPYDGKIDMWSLGCVVAEMYTGEVTFQNDSELSMLSRIEAICGPFPRHMIAKGRHSHRIFTDSGLIYEKVSNVHEEDDASSSDENSETSLFNVYQPKMTNLAARFGFDADLMEKPRLSVDDEKRAMFVDFVSKLLAIDPELRLSAEEALKHPWILSSLELSEDDILYPPR